MKAWRLSTISLAPVLRVEGRGDGCSFRNNSNISSYPPRVAPEDFNGALLTH